MSEGKKRSRKSKLEVREDVEIVEDETDITLLQEEPKPKIPKFLQPKPVDDHNYSLISTSPPSIEVKIEVEEFDENDLQLSPNPQPAAKIIDTVLNDPKSSKTIFVSNIDVERMIKVSEHIEWSSTNYADKCLNIEMKNYWGKFLMDITKEEYDPYDQLIQKALEFWSVGGAFKYKLVRDSPLFYQCHICFQAWWNLYPFREHIKQHDLDKLYITHQGYIANIKSDTEISVLIATDTFTTNNNKETFKYIPVDGNCKKCGQDSAKHQKLIYPCKECAYVFYSCLRLRKHQEHCPLRIKLYGCDVCYFTFTTEKEWQDHLKLTHSVRSDEPLHIITEICETCNKKFVKPLYQNHYCVKGAKFHCKYCYRMFGTRSKSLLHLQNAEKDVQCKICMKKFEWECQIAEHMLLHTDNYVMTHNCTINDCRLRNKMVLPNIETMRLHKTRHHQSKLDKRYMSNKMPMPKQCLKLVPLEWEGECDAPSLSACTSIASKSNEDKSNENEMENIQINHNRQDVQSQDEDASDDSQDGMSYMQLLSNLMFPGSNVEEQNQDEEQNIKIKTEPNDLEYDEEGNSSQLTIEDTCIKTEPEEYCDVKEEIADTEIASEESVIVPEIKEEPTDYDNCEEDNTSGDIVIKNVTSLRVHSTENPPEVNSSETLPKETSSPNVTEEISTVNVPGNVSGEKVKFKVYGGDSSGKSISSVLESLAKRSMPIPSAKSFRKIMKSEFQQVKKQEKSIKSKKKLKVYKKATIHKQLDKQVTEEMQPESTLNEELVIKAEPVDLDDREFITVDVDLLNSIKEEQDSVENNLKMIEEMGKTPGKRSKRNVKMYKCKKCGFTAKHKFFVQHKLSHCQYGSPKSSYPCTKCHLSFPSLKSYLDHFKHHGYKSLHCPACDEKFLEGMFHLEMHFQKHIRHNYVKQVSITENVEEVSNKNKCKICKELIPRDKFFPHWELHLKLKDKKRVEKPPVQVSLVLNDDDDDDSFTNKPLSPEKLALGLRQLISPSRMKECGVCYRRFARNYESKRHIIEHFLSDAYAKKRASSDRSLRCQECNAPFKDAYNYKFHMREHGGLPVYKCDICNKTFSDSSNFAKHKKVHDLRVMICDICGKKFQLKKTLEKHIALHSEIGQIQCKLCDKTFYSQSAYSKHEKSSHGQRSIKYRCNLCGIRFDSLKDKWDHDWQTHGERKNLNDCPICLREFRKFLDLKNHAKIDHFIQLKRFKTKCKGDGTNYKYFYKMISLDEQNVIFVEE